MPRSKRRHINTMGPEDDERILTKRVKCGRRVSKSEDTSSFSQKRCLAWFREYTTLDDPDMLGPEGMEKFCEDIGVEPENVVMLVLAWKMNARQMGFFSQQEWLKGLTDLQCDTIHKLQSKLEHLRLQLNDQALFKSIYRYAYDFARIIPSVASLTESTFELPDPVMLSAKDAINMYSYKTDWDKNQRSMDIETAKAMLQLLLGKHWTLFSQFNLFLEQSKYKVINKDQWCNILEFSRTNNSDLSNYDVDGAWPVMLDEFVEWFKGSKEGRRS